MTPRTKFDAYLHFSETAATIRILKERKQHQIIHHRRGAHAVAAWQPDLGASREQHAVRPGSPEIWRFSMRFSLFTAALGLGFAIAAPAFASAQTHGNITL